MGYVDSAISPSVVIGEINVSLQVKINFILKYDNKPHLAKSYFSYILVRLHQIFNMCYLRICIWILPPTPKMVISNLPITILIENGKFFKKNNNLPVLL